MCTPSEIGRSREWILDGMTAGVFGLDGDDSENPLFPTRAQLDGFEYPPKKSFMLYSLSEELEQKK